MIARPSGLGSLLFLTACLWSVPLASAPAAASGSAANVVGSVSHSSPYAGLPAELGDALVTVRHLVAVSMPGANRETDREVVCLMVDPKGLILCSSTQMGGFYSVMARLMGRSPGSINTRALDLKVEIPDVEEEWPARMIARDSDRDLAWILLDDVPEDSRFVHIDFRRATRPGIGDQVFLLRRLGTFFESPAVVSEVTIAAQLQRPRDLWLASRPMGHLGMPVLDAGGRAVGITVVQVPRPGEGSASASVRGLPGQAGPEDDMVGGLILPAVDIVKATELALETWHADQAEATP